MTSLLQPAYLELAEQRLFAIAHKADLRDRSEIVTVIAQPFAEELNKCRRLLNLVGRAIALRDQDVVLFDYAGTGDSDGSFAESSLDSYQRDLTLISDHLLQKGYNKIRLLTVRAASLLAPEWIARYSHQCEQIVLLQPVTQGGAWLREFFRTAIVAGDYQDVKSLLNDLKHKDQISVAGYVISKDWVDGLSNALLTAQTLSMVDQVTIIWNKLVDSQPLPNNLIKLSDDLVGKGKLPLLKQVTADAYWRSVEITAPMAVVEAASEVI